MFRIDKRTTARFGMLGANTVAELGDFHSRPFHVTCSGNQASHNAGLADITRVSTNDNERQGWCLSLVDGAFTGRPLLPTPVRPKPLFGILANDFLQHAVEQCRVG